MGTLFATMTDSYAAAQIDERANVKFRSVILKPSRTLGDHKRVFGLTP